MEPTDVPILHAMLFTLKSTYVPRSLRKYKLKEKIFESINQKLAGDKK